MWLLWVDWTDVVGAGVVAAVMGLLWLRKRESL